MLLGRSTEEIIALLIALIPAFTVHEFAHAWAANRLGDPTAKDLGRLTLNPLKHLDVMGTLMVLMVGIGWAKPVPVNPYNLKHGRRDMALVAVVGPLSNLIMAVLVAFLWGLTDFAGDQLVRMILITFVYLNIALLFFNLLPVAPLDGFKVALGILPVSWANALAKTAQIGPMVLFGLIILGSFIPGVDLLGWIVWKPTEALVSMLLS
ncbi:MAG: site-2 protease family protein [Chloroflexota bacterium]|nr:site-2 protease family protein [Chloroflexota bacterium]